MNFVNLPTAQFTKVVSPGQLIDSGVNVAANASQHLCIFILVIEAHFHKQLHHAVEYATYSTPTRARSSHVVCAKVAVDDPSSRVGGVRVMRPMQWWTLRRTLA